MSGGSRLCALSRLIWDQNSGINSAQGLTDIVFLVKQNNSKTKIFSLNLKMNYNYLLGKTYAMHHHPKCVSFLKYTCITGSLLLPSLPPPCCCCCPFAIGEAPSICIFLSVIPTVFNCYFWAPGQTAPSYAWLPTGNAKVFFLMRPSI
jgi:hypothetical protein